MIKKLLSVLCVAALTVIPLLPSAAAADETADYGLINMIGIATDSKSGIENVTRGEFADYIVKAVNQNGAVANGEVRFWDVSADTEYGASINRLYDMSVTKGYSDHSFRPYEPITFSEAVRMINTILGYSVYSETKGGYPLGDLLVAGQLGISRSLSYGADDRINRAAAWTMLTKALDTVMLKSSSVGERNTYSDSDGITLLNKYFDIYKTDGVIVANSDSSLSQDIAPTDGKILLDSNLLFYSEGALADGLLGCRVDCYYYNESNEVACIIRSADNRELTVEADGSPVLEGSTVKYFDGNKKLSIETAAHTAYLKNGRPINYSADFNSALFDISDGYIRAVDNNNDSVYDAIFIISYKYVYVNSVDDDEKIIYDELSKANSVCLDSSVTYRIYDEDGIALSFEKIAAGDALTVEESADKKYVRVTVSKKTVTGTLTEYSSTDREAVINGNVCRLTPELIKYKNPKLAVGKPLSANLSADGKIVWYQLIDGTDGFVTAVLMNIGAVDGMNSDFSAKLYSIADNKYQYFKVAKKPVIDGKQYKDSFVDLFKTGGKVVPVPIRYMCNTAGEINVIDTPTMTTEEDEETLCKRYSTQDGQLIYKSGTLGGRYAFDTGTSFLLVTEEGSGYAAERVDSLKGDKLYNLDVYSIGIDSPECKIVVLNSGSADATISMDTTLSVMDEYSLVYDDTDEERTDDFYYSLSLYTAGRKVSAKVKPEDFSYLNDLSRGDIIRYALDMQGYVSAVEKVFDYKTKTPVMTANPTTAFNANAETRYVYGKAYLAKNGFVRIALDLSDIKDLTMETFPDAGYKYEVANDKLYLSSVTGRDISGYKNIGNDACGVFVHTRYSKVLSLYYIK